MAIPMSPRREAVSNYGFYAWIAFLSVFVVLGLIGVYRQTTQGHYLTGLSDVTPWGLYITGFVFFVGTSAGATIVGLMLHAFRRDDYAPLATRALLVGLLSLAAAVMFITVDVGNVPRMLRLPFIWHNPKSMFTWTASTYYAFGLLLLGELYFAIKMTRGEATNSDRTMAKWLAIAAVPFALIVVHAPHGGLFAVIKARDFWASPLLPPHFAVAALLSGTAMVMIMAIVSSVIGGRDLVSRKTLAHMGALLAAFIVVAAFMDFFDWLVALYTDEAAGNSALHMLSDENIAFSIVHVGGYALALTILLLNQGRSVGALAVASVLAVLAVASYRYNLTSVGQEVPLYPFLENASYSPTWVEISVALGIVALITLAYSVITRVIPLDEPAAAEE